MKKPIKNTFFDKMKELIKNTLLNFPILNYYIKKKLGNADAIELVLGLYLKKVIKTNHKPFFIQIGANNGVNRDPFYKFITKHTLSGILIEPVSFLFDQLKKNYQNRQGLFFENVAIGNPQEHLTFYRINSAKNKFYDQLGSFNKATILKHKKNIPNLEELIIEEPVQVMDFNTLVKKYQKKKIDILIMDTEGYDGEIIKMIDFNNIDFDLVIFESKHLSTLEHKSCISLLQSHNFKSIVNKSDTICIKNDLADILKHTDELHSENIEK